MKDLSCIYCQNPLPKRRQKYCSDLCNRRYFEEVLEPLWWNNARDVALRRANHCCEECGQKDKLEVHHLIFLEPGEKRHNSPKNRQDNLIVLCRRHHEQVHHPATSPWSPQLRLEVCSLGSP